MSVTVLGHGVIAFFHTPCAIPESLLKSQCPRPLKTLTLNGMKGNRVRERERGRGYVGPIGVLA